MSNNTGTLVIAPIRPQSTQDTYPSAYATELLGGFYQVDSIVTMNAIPTSRRVLGMRCYVATGSVTYALIGGLDNSNWVLESSQFPAGGHVIQYNSSSLPQEPNLLFTGNGVTVTNNAAGSASVVNIPGGVQSITLSGAVTGSGTGSIVTSFSTPPITSVTGAVPIISSGGTTPVISLASSSVVPGFYTNTNLTVDAYGRVTSAASATSSVQTPLVIPMSVSGPSTIPTSGQLFVGEESVGGIDSYVGCCLDFDESAINMGGGNYTIPDYTGRHVISSGNQGGGSYNRVTGKFGLGNSLGGTNGIATCWCSSNVSGNQHDFDWVGDYTLDFWMNLSSTAPSYLGVQIMTPVMMNYYAGNLNDYWQFKADYNNHWITFTYGQTGLSGLPYITVGMTPYYNAWHHFAFVKFGLNMTVYVDGIAVSSEAFTTQPVAFASVGNGGYYQSSVWGLNLSSDGNVGPAVIYDEMRFSKGIARWTTNFTPPITPYVNTAVFANGLYFIDGFGQEYSLTSVSSLSAANVGSGSGVFAQELSQVFQFKSIEAGTGVGISDDGSTITVSATGTSGVSSVNSMTGSVVLTTTNIAEGTNEYFTVARGSSSVNTVLQAIEGVPNGLATLNSSGIVPTSQLPSSSVVSALTIQGSGSGGGGVTVTNVNNINFDYTTGFNVTNEGSGSVLVSLGSAFATINTPLGSNLVASGEDTYSNLAPGSITITGSDTPGSKSISFALVNDNATPGDNQYYGTNSSGTKGYFTLSTGSTPLTIQYNSASMPTEPALNFTGNVQVTDNPGTASVVNILGAGSSLTYYFQVTSSSVAGDRSMIITPYTPKTSVVNDDVVSGSNFQSYITPAGVPNVTFIPAGQFEFHIHASKSGGTAELYGEAWETDATGSIIGLICTSETSSALTGSEIEYELYAVTPNTYTMRSASSRILCQLYATTTSLPNITVYEGDEADSHLSLPSVTVDASNFIPYNGATLDVNLGSHNITTTGSASVNNIQITSASVVGDVLTALDSFGNSHWAVPSNATITLSGAVTGSGSTSIVTTLATSSVSAGSYTNSNITVDSYGRVTAAANGQAGSGSSALSANTTVNFTSSMSAATIQGLISAQPKNLNGYTLTFQFGNGTYTLNAILSFSYFYGGTLLITGNQSESGQHINQAVILDFSSTSDTGIQCQTNTANVTLQNLNIKYLTTGGNAGMYILYGNLVTTIQGCYFQGDSTASGGGIQVFYGFANVLNNYFTKGYLAIGANNASIVVSSTNSSTGTDPAYGLYVQSGILMKGNATQPAGSSGASTTSGGGQVFG